MTTKKLPSKKMKMKGLMCQSRAATAVCTVGDPCSVIMPRRPQEIKTTSVKYSRLAESSSSSSSSMKFLPPPTSKSVIVSSIKKQENNNNNNNNKKQEYYRAKLPMQKPPSVLASSDHQQVFQVVVMRVSLHCQGCAGKVKKHLSKMEGVTSFSIDLETKRVTVMGHVSPVGVLQSISKVKPAEFWPS